MSTPATASDSFHRQEPIMYVMQEAHARERMREAEANAAASRMASRAASAQRWERWANWTAHRSARATRAFKEARMSANVRG
ncbi:MAG: hypothetical protein ABJA87_02310 [bacterium]